MTSQDMDFNRYIPPDDDAFFAGHPPLTPEQMTMLFHDEAKPPERQHFVDGRDILFDHALSMLCPGRFFMTADTSDTFDHYKILIRDLYDKNLYFLEKSDDFDTLHPFDTIALYKQFDRDKISELGPIKEFIYNGKNILAGIDLAPWYQEKETIDEHTGEIKPGQIKSYFKYERDNGKLHYKSGTTRYYRTQADDFKMEYSYEYMFECKYGLKIKQNGIWRYDLHNPRNTFYLGNISSYNGAFIDIITYDKLYKQNQGKYDLIKNTVLILLRDTISTACDVKPDDIYIPHKMISCVFKHNWEKIKKTLERPPVKRTKTGKISRVKPKPMAPAKDIMSAIGVFSKYINSGYKPNDEFYNCEICKSESVCMYKEHMKKNYANIKTKQIQENETKYRKQNNGQGYLFPGLLIDMDHRIK